MSRFTLRENKRAELRLLVGAPDRSLGLEQAHVETLAAGETKWRRKDLTPATWRDLGRGVCALTLEAEEVGSIGTLSILVRGRDGLDPPLAPSLHSYEVVPWIDASDRRPARTRLVGRVENVDEQPIANAAIIIKPVQPIAVGDLLVAAQTVTKEADADGKFSFDLPTGAVLHVSIPAVPFNKQIVVPPPLAIGMPVPLFSL